MAQSTVKELNQKLKDGEHEMYKDMYKFNVKLENGEEGVVNGKKKEGPAYKVGDAVEYEILFENEYGKLWSMKRLKEYHKDKKYESKYNDPLSIKRMALSTAQDLTIEFIKALGKSAPQSVAQINSGAKIFNEWILQGGGDKDRDIATKRYRALEKAVKCVEWENFGIIDHKKLLEIAEEFMIPMNELDE